MARQTSSERRWRLDEPHRKPPNPHLFDLPRKPEIRLLLIQLDDDDVDLRRFARRLSLFQGLDRYIVALANYRLAGRGHRVSDSSHASAVLGIRGLHDALRPLLEMEPPSAIAG